MKPSGPLADKMRINADDDNCAVITMHDADDKLLMKIVLSPGGLDMAIQRLQAIKSGMAQKLCSHEVH